ncbi:MAG: hypothetical protein JJT94_17045 [Bernardetiaceae bacterium]|nr:hypothetical protein [Bernardetiaceae bacterium]
MDKTKLLDKIQHLKDLTEEEKKILTDALTKQKKYGLVWEDKPEDVEQKLAKELPIFIEDKSKAILAKKLNALKGEQQNLQEDKPQNAPNHILIEGDNLHALTALSFTHKEKIDVIYIDPPYNTGNKDFKYNDHFVDKEDQYRHSKWLAFMQKRLKIAKTLLKDSGVIFISIDDNENAQLKILCDEIFGEENFVSDIIWQSRKSVSNDTFVSLNHNYTLFYGKNISFLNKNDFRLPVSKEKFNNPDNDPRGAWIADPFDAPNIRPNLTYIIKNPNTNEEFLPPKGRCWRTTEEEYLKLLKDNRIVFGKSGKTKPQLKRFLSFAKDKGTTPISIWNDLETTTNGTQQLENIFGLKKFTNPKPLGLLNRILKLSSQKDSLILDFFAGSGTTLHAVMELNKEDGGKRSCILVTNNENNICEEVTYERNKRVIEGYTNKKGEIVSGLRENNLRYYRCGFVGSEKTEANRRLLTARSTELLQIKEDCYEELTEGAGFSASACRIFYNVFSDKYMGVVYYSRDMYSVLEALRDYILTLKLSGAFHLYAFSPESDSLLDFFEDIQDKLVLVPLPEAIYNAYIKTIPDPKGGFKTP